MKTVSAPRPDARGASTFDRWRSRHGDGTIGPARLALRLIVEAAFENLGSNSPKRARLTPISRQSLSGWCLDSATSQSEQSVTEDREPL